MSKFNTSTARVTGRSAVASSETPDGHTHQGGTGYSRDQKSELFLAAVTSFTDATFYEAENARLDRQRLLARSVAVADPEWMLSFLTWLRTDARIRTAAVILAAEAVKGRIDSKVDDTPKPWVITAKLDKEGVAVGATSPLSVNQRGYSRRMIDAVLQRPDEPGEMLAYWTSRYGRRLPKPVKRGIADAATRLYSQRSLLKYDGQSKGFRFADVLDLTHPTAKNDTQAQLFQHALDRRHNRDEQPLNGLPILANNASLRKRSAEDILRMATSGELAVVLNDAGMTWEAVPSLVNGPWTKELWECVAEGSPVWLPDGRAIPVEDVVAQRLPVLSYDQEWDMREPGAGRPYPPRSRDTGTLQAADPVRWLDSGVRDVFAVKFASGRELRVTAGHRWAARKKDVANGRPVWKTTEELSPGWAVPTPLDAGRFGSLGDELEGWFVGSMLGDGGMTSRTPIWSGQDDGTLQAVKQYAAKFGCSVNVDPPSRGCVRARIVDERWHQNAVRDELIVHQVWGLHAREKSFAPLPYSKAFVRGAIAGLIDSDGSVGERDVEFAVISESLARQFADMALRLGVMSNISVKRDNWMGNHALWRVRISDIRSIQKLADEIELRSERKAARLDALANSGRASRRASREYAENIAWDRIVSIEPAGTARTYCVQVEPSNLWVVNGIVTGNCIIPSMGVMALTRNLAGFDRAGVGPAAAQIVADKLTDAEEVERSRILPMRLLSAYRAAPNVRWVAPLEGALQHSLANIPALDGNTLILVDRSGSMFSPMSNRTDLTRADAAAVFGVALALRAAKATLVQFGSTAHEVKVPKGGSVLPMISTFTDLGGTDTASAVRQFLTPQHTRVVILTDDQTGGRWYHGGTDPGSVVPPTVPLHTFDLVGYQRGGTAGGPHRYIYSSLSDASWPLIELNERGAIDTWPWS